MASTTAKYNDPANIFEINGGCDLVFPCLNSPTAQLNDQAITALSSRGCIGVIEGVQHAMTGNIFE